MALGFGVGCGTAGAVKRGPRARAPRMGLTAASVNRRFRQAGPASLPQLQGALDFADYATALGGGGIQDAVSRLDVGAARAIRERVDSGGFYYEGQVALPEDEADARRFSDQLVLLREAGGKVTRTVFLSGRRYETFADLDAYRAWQANSWRRLQLAEPIARRAQVKLAIENHKDLRIPELLAIVRRISSPWVGICVDTGNSLALLEDPTETVSAFAPFALTTHLKDMAVQPAEGGFLLSEVPLGRGILDLPRIVERLRDANPRIAFNLEMITRDPLFVPCKTESFWRTFSERRDGDLERTLALVDENAFPGTLPRTTSLSPERQVELEDLHLRQSYDFASARLSL